MIGKHSVSREVECILKIHLQNDIRRRIVLNEINYSKPSIMAYNSCYLLNDCCKEAFVTHHRHLKDSSLVINIGKGPI